MPNTGHYWTAAEVSALREAYLQKPAFVNTSDFCRAYAKKAGVTVLAVKGKLVEQREKGEIKQTIRESTYPSYDNPLEMEGDALIMTDVEFPYHHADFMNKCLDLAQAWGIDQLILGGDTLHFGSLSSFDPNWQKDNPGGLSENAETKLMQFIKKLPAKKQGEAMELIAEIGREETEDGATSELETARRELRRLEKRFEHIDFVIGNHEGRFLRAMQTTISPRELLRLLDITDKDPRWRVSPHYYSVLYSGGKKYQIEHPKNSGKFSASRLASKYLCNVIMGHSHQLNYTYDPSGEYYAIESGHCVDEARLPYAAQRHNTSPSHCLGAVIVRDGYPYLLHKNTQWDMVAKMV